MGVVLRELVKRALPDSLILRIGERKRSESTLVCRFSIGRTQLAEDFSTDPIVSALRRLMSRPARPIEELAFELTEAFCAIRAHPKMTVGQLYGIRRPSLDYPLWARVAPWEEITPAQRYRRTPDSARRDRKKHGLSLSRREVISALETPTRAAMYSQASQYARLVQSIRENGAQLDWEPLPLVWLLTDGASLRWVLGSGGNHRSRIYAAMGLESFLGRVQGLVDVRQVDSWHCVRSGVFSRDEAVGIFWQYLNAVPFLARD